MILENAKAVVAAVVPAAVMLSDKYIPLGFTDAEEALVVTALTAIFVWLVPNKEKAQ